MVGVHQQQQQQHQQQQQQQWLTLAARGSGLNTRTQASWMLRVFIFFQCFILLLCTWYLVPGMFYFFSYLIPGTWYGVLKQQVSYIFNIVIF